MAKDYNTFTDVSTGDVYTAAAHNLLLENVENYRVPPSCRLERATGQVVYDASTATIVWDQEAWDTDTMHDLSTNQDRITIKTAGIYLVVGAVRYTAGISDDASITILENGTLVVRDEGGPANTAGGRTVSVMLNLAVNDYLQMQVYQNNSANTSRTTTSGTFFSAVWLGQAS